MGIRTKMLAMIAAPTLVIYIGLVGFMIIHLEHEARDQLFDETTHLAENYAARVDGAFREASAIATTTARQLETTPQSEEQIFAQLEHNIRQDPVIYGAATAFIPGVRESDTELYCPYVYRDGDSLSRMLIDETVLDWLNDEQWQWFRIPRETGRGVWTDPYFDEGAGNVLMVTYSAPFFDRGGFQGVTTVDLELPALGRTFAPFVEEGLDWFIVTREGRYVFNSRRPETIMSLTLFDVIEEAGRADLAPLVERIVSGESGVQSMKDLIGEGQQQWIFFSPIESTGWVFGALVPEATALAPVRQNIRFAAATLLVTLVLIIGAVYVASGMLARPIRQLDAAVEEIASGDLDARVEGVTSRDEIGRLAGRFNAMTADLRANLDTIAEERAAREKIERDLDLAREIQRGLLPQKPLSAPGFEVAGWNRAADKTGGDYFDWLELPDGRTIVTLADVTGHGIGPALIAAVCRAYMRASATGEGDLGTVLSRVNALLYADTTSGRFVTAAVGVLNPSTGTMAFFSAGQAPTILYTAATGEVTSWEADDLPLAVMDEMSPESSREISLAAGDLLVLTTDGFFEWANESGEQFGTARLAASIRARATEEPEAIIAGLYEDVLRHAGGTVQGDDLTAVVIKKV